MANLFIFVPCQLYFLDNGTLGVAASSFISFWTMESLDRTKLGKFQFLYKIFQQNITPKHFIYKPARPNFTPKHFCMWVYHIHAPSYLEWEVIWLEIKGINT